MNFTPTLEGPIDRPGQLSGFSRALQDPAFTRTKKKNLFTGLIQTATFLSFFFNVPLLIAKTTATQDV